MNYLRLFPAEVAIISVAALLFAILAYLAFRVRGSRGVWFVWILYVPALTWACVLALSRVWSGLGTGVVIYYAAVAMAAVGLPLAVSALVLTRVSTRKPPASPIAAVLFGWLAGVLATPLALAMVALVDRFSPIG